MVEAALNDAFEGGKVFGSIDEVDSYLRDTGVNENLLQPFGREIFDCYLRLEKEVRNRQVPSPSQSVEPQLNMVETGQEAEDCRERNDNAAPAFASDVS
jgi:hypothetical protein